MTVFTIGYEGIDFDEFISLLSEHEIDTVVDIRELPLSRKPGFSKKAMSAALNLTGFEYVHMADLGCPKPVRDQFREDGNWKSYADGFLKHLASQDAAVAKLSNYVGSSNCALLCFEADFNRCHRSLVANAVRDFCGADVEHIKASDAKTRNSDSRRLAFA